MAVWLVATFIVGTIGYLDLTNIRLPKYGKIKFYPDHIISTMDKVAFHEYIFSVGTGKLGSLVGLVNKVGWGTIILAALHLDKFIFLLPLAMITFPIGAYLFGYFLHYIKYIYRQGDVNNRLTNPQLIRTENIGKEILEKLNEK